MSEMGPEVGGAHVRIDPDLSRFREELLAELKAAMAGVREQATVLINGDDSPLKAKVAESLVVVRSFASQVAEARLGLDSTAFDAGLAADEAKLAAVGREVARPKVVPKLDETVFTARLASIMSSADVAYARAMSAAAAGDAAAERARQTVAGFDAALTGEEAKLAAIGEQVVRPKIVPVLDETAFMGQLRAAADAAGVAYLRGLAAAAAGNATAERTDQNITAGLSMLGTSEPAGGGGLGALLSAGVLGMFAGHGGGGGGGGLFSALGFGTSGVPFLGALAGFGTIGSLLGFGAEHVLTTLLGVGGSAVGAGIGGGLLGLGALGTMGVGMGTDMAGLGQAANDIRSVVQAQNQLNQAIAVYGRNSTQARAAQQQLNYTLSSFSPIARQAVLAAANTAQQFHQMFNAATGEAEKIGAQIIQQAMKVGEAFLPTIGKFAAQNLGIIQRDIQPLFAWLQNPGKQGGLGIFTDLEKIFQANLPTAIHAITQGIELFAKTVDVAAHYTGGFVRAINDFLTKANSPTGFAKWSKDIGTLIGLFKTFVSFGVEVGKVLAHLFEPAAGAGKALIQMLTGLLRDIDKWLTKTSTKNALHGLFDAHLVELIRGVGGALKAALPILESFAGAMVKVLTAGAKIGTLLLKPITALLNLIDRHPLVKELLGWALAIGIVGKALLGLVTANPILAGITLAILGIYEVAKHWGAIWGAVKKAADVVWNGLKTGAEDVWHFLDRIWQDVENGVKVAWDWIKSHLGVVVPAALALITGPIGALVGFLLTHWHTIERDVTVAWDAIVNFIRGIPGKVVSALSTFAADAYNAAHGAWTRFSDGIKNVTTDVITFVKAIPGKIVTALGDLGSLLWNAGKAVINGFVGGLESVWHNVTSFIGGIASWISKHKGPLDYDATLLTPHGLAIMQSLHAGLTAGFDSQVLPLVQGMAPRLAAALNTRGAFGFGWDGAALSRFASPTGGAGVTQPVLMPVNLTIDGQTLSGSLDARMTIVANRVVASSVAKVVALKKQGVSLSPVSR